MSCCAFWVVVQVDVDRTVQYLFAVRSDSSGNSDDKERCDRDGEERPRGAAVEVGAVVPGSDECDGEGAGSGKVDGDESSNRHLPGACKERDECSRDGKEPSDEDRRGPEAVDGGVGAGELVASHCEASSVEE